MCMLVCVCGDLFWLNVILYEFEWFVNGETNRFDARHLSNNLFCEEFGVRSHHNTAYCRQFLFVEAQMERQHWTLVNNFELETWAVPQTTKLFCILLRIIIIILNWIFNGTVPWTWKLFKTQFPASFYSQQQ